MKTLEFYTFINERENIRLRKQRGEPAPWTTDPILQEYKFTNVRREHDKTTQRLIELFYCSKGQTAPKKQILFNCALFRYFGTWEFAEEIGWQEDYIPQDIISLAAQRLKKGERVFTGAYVITNQGIKAPKEEVVTKIFLKGVWDMADAIIDDLEATNRWQSVHQRMEQIQGFGGSGFMAKEVLLDTMHCNFWTNSGKPDDYWEWTPIGPGARRGINRILGKHKDAPLKESEALQTLLSLTFEQSKYWPAEWGKLAPTDLQFASCEYDKWCRVKTGEGRPRSKYHYEKKI